MSPHYPRNAVPVTDRVERPLKIVFFPLCWVMAHVGRTLEIARQLRDRGHEVVFAGADADHPLSRLDHARRQGFRTVPVKEPDWPWAWQRFQKYGGMLTFLDLLTHQRWAPLEEIMEDIVRVTREEAPDLIVGDASLGVSCAGHITGTPAATLFNAYNVRFYQPWNPLRYVIDTMDRHYWGPIRARVYRRHGVEPIGGYELWQQTLVLAPDLPELFAPLPEFPRWTPIGPLVSEPPSDLPDWFDELDDGTPNIYITMGSTGFLEPFLDRVYADLGRSHYRFIVTTARQVSDPCIRRAPGNFRFTDYAPGSRLLSRSEAMIFHGGNGTMYQALAAGVPMLSLPSHQEQKINTRKAVSEGFGLAGNVRRITGGQVLAQLDRLIQDPAFRANAWRFRRAVRNSQGPALAAELLEQRARTRRAAATA